MEPGLYILLFMLVAAPLADYIPLASFGAVLAIVAWNMAEKRELWRLMRSSRGDAAVLLSTFLLTIFEDLTVAIAVGVTLGAFLFLHHMAESIEIETGHHAIAEDQADTRGADRTPYDTGKLNNDLMVYRISGAFFFGTTSAVSAVLDRIGDHPKVFVFDFTNVPLVDSSAANALLGFVEKLRRSGTQVYFAGAGRAVQSTLHKAGLDASLVHSVATPDDAVRATCSDTA